MKSPHVWILLWLAFLGSAIWWHAKRATQPPLYDAVTYYAKAANLWANLHSRHWQNPLEVEPTFRPPGVVLMSYPLGFRQDFRGFYFRSSYFPVILLVLAVYLAGYSPGAQLQQQWSLAFLAVLLSTLPALYHFEIANFDRASEYWGLVDPFLLGMASLATAALVRSLRNLSLGWLAAATVIAAYCLLIKPSGIIVMACIAVSALVAALMRLKFTKEPEKRKEVAQLLLRGALLTALLYGITLFVCFHSNYLSGSGAALGKSTMAIMRAELSLPLEQLPGTLNPHFGVMIPCGLLLLGVAAIVCWKRLDPVLLGWGPAVFGSLLFSSAFFSVVGLWFLIWSGGIDQIRYLSPFVLMAVICQVPLLTAVMREVASGMRVGFWCFSLVAAANLALLLIAKDPAVKWQAVTGVNLTTGHYQVEVREARRFVQQLRSSNQNALIYSFCSGVSTAIFEEELGFETGRDPASPKIFEQHPIDWSRPSAVHVGELLDSQYVLFDVIPEPNGSRILAQKEISTVADELLVFNAWFTGLTERDGVKTVASGPFFRLVAITDFNKLEASLTRLVSAHQWSENFVQANPPRWWHRSDVAEMAKRFPPAIQDVTFGDLFKIHELSLEKKGKTVTIRAWLAPLHRDSSERWFMFCHQIDAKGAIVSSSDFLLPEQAPEHPSDNFLMKTMTFDLTDSQLVKTLGIGIRVASPLIRTLPADKGPRDWDNHRIILSLPADAQSPGAG